MAEELLVAEDLAKSFKRFGRPPVNAIDGIDIRVDRGTTVGLVGESGAGKSTILRCLLALERPDRGTISFEGSEITSMKKAQLHAYRRAVQAVFQDPAGSLNPRMTVAELVAEGMIIHHRASGKTQLRDRVAQQLEHVGLSPSAMTRRPASFSGGQLQRIAIARALAVEPQLLICDEPTSSLDVSVQAQVLNLLADMQAELGLSILLVSHNLAVIKYLCSTVFVLQHGRIVEAGTADQVFGDPQHDYTKQLLAAVPRPDATASRL